MIRTDYYLIRHSLLFKFLLRAHWTSFQIIAGTEYAIEPRSIFSTISSVRTCGINFDHFPHGHNHFHQEVLPFMTFTIHLHAFTDSLTSQLHRTTLSCHVFTVPCQSVSVRRVTALIYGPMPPVILSERFLISSLATAGAVLLFLQWGNTSMLSVWYIYIKVDWLESRLLNIMGRVGDRLGNQCVKFHDS